MPERQAAVHTERAAGLVQTLPGFRPRNTARPSSCGVFPLVRFHVSDPSALCALDAYTRGPQSRFVGSATRAAVRQLAVNDHGGDAADAVLLRLRGPRTLVHVHHLHVTRRTRDSVHERDRLLTGGHPALKISIFRLVVTLLLLWRSEDSRPGLERMQDRGYRLRPLGVTSTHRAMPRRGRPHRRTSWGPSAARTAREG